MPPKNKYQAAIPTNALSGLIYSSPLDFTAAFNASDSLTITFPGGVTYVPADAADILWLGMRYVNAAGQDIYLDNTSYDFDYESGTNLLTITPDPGLAAGGQYGAMLLGPPRDAAALAAIAALLVTIDADTSLISDSTTIIEGDTTSMDDKFTDLNLLVTTIQDLTKALNQQAGMGLPGSYFSPVDFTAVRHDADELNCTGIPGSPSKAQFLSVVEKENGAIRRKWTAGVDQFEWDAANQRLQIVGVTFSADASAEWTVTYIGQVKGHDSVLNAAQIVRMNADQWDWKDSQPVFDAELLGGTPDVSGSFNVKGDTVVGLFIAWTTPATAGAYTVDVGFNANDTDAGTNQYVGLTGDSEYPTTPAAPVQMLDAAFRLPVGAESQTYYHFMRLSPKAANRIQVTLQEAIPGALHITATVYLILMNP